MAREKRKPVLQSDKNQVPVSLSDTVINLLLLESCRRNLQSSVAPLLESTSIIVDSTLVDTLDAAFEKINTSAVDVLVWHMDNTGPHFLEDVVTITSNFPEIPLVILSDHTDEEFLFDCLHLGAQECISLEQATVSDLPRIVRNAIERNHIIIENNYLLKDIGRHDRKKLVSELSVAHGKLKWEETRYRHLESALQFERNYAATILDTMDALLVILDSEGNIQKFNRAFEELSGYTSTEVQGNNYWDIILPPEEAEEAWRVFKELTSGDFPNRHENYITTKDKHRHLISWSNSAIPGKDGHIKYVVGTGVDITKQRQAENELWVYYNQLAELVEARTADLLRSNERLQVEIDERKKTERKLQHHREHLEELVTERTQKLSTALLRLDKEIEERKQAEAAEKKHMMEAAHFSRLNTMGEMITEISHELNQPLAAISIYSDACLRLLKSENAQQNDIINAMQDIDAQAKRADSVLKRVREFARRREIRLDNMDVNELVREVTHLIEIEARWHGVELQIMMSDPLPKISADRILIEQVILNLVRNAIEAMNSTPDGKRKLCIRTINKGTSIVVSVMDTGPGLHGVNKASVFEPFVTTKTNGVGMGLSICASIIDSHGGSMWTESNPEGGAVFCFALPAKHIDINQETEDA